MRTAIGAGTPIKAIVFSKQRPMQLDLLLTSLERNAPGIFDVSVLYNSRGMEEGYEICASEHPDATFIAEDSLTYQVRSLLGDAASLFRGAGVAFFTDDDVLYRPLEDLWIGRECVCLSLRLGRNTTYCYPHGREQAFPVPLESESAYWYVWEWERAEGDFNYPMSLDGHVFRAEDLLPLLSHFTTPNWLEVMLMRGAKEIGKPYMVCPPESHVVGLPINRVQSEMPNRNGDTHFYSVQELNNRYLSGERIDLDALDFSDIRGAHQEIPLVFR